MRRPTSILSAGVALFLAGAACRQVLGDDWRIAADSGSLDASGAAPASDGGDAGEAAIEGDAGEAGSVCAPESDATVYHDMTSRSFWSTFDVATLNPNAKPFWGAAFDGRYVYFVPALSGVVVRYDTQRSFNTASSWETFDATNLNSSAKVFNGAVFDGRYVYFVPHDGASSAVIRFDTAQQSFATVSSWDTFDTTTVDARAKSFSGASFDGRYVYLAPNAGAVAVRYDTKATFGTVSSWSFFDVATTSPTAKGFAGAVFDGQYVYFLANSVARYDTRAAAFNTAASWTTFDVTTVSPTAKVFVGGAFDGRHLYLAPLQNSGSTSDGVVVRYDSNKTFDVATSWSTFDTTMVNGSAKNYDGALFDGRYVYFVPQGTGIDDVVARLDTQGDFNISASWTTFDTTATFSAGGFVGAAFDGRYVYFAPYASGASYSGIVARFDAKTPASIPCLPAFHGSFL